MAPGPEIGSGCEIPQPLAPTRIAGRCGLRGSRKGATALSRTFFVPRNPCVPTAPAFFQASPQTRLTGRDRAVWEAGRGRDATQRGKAAQTASQGQTAGNGPGWPLGPPAAALGDSNNSHHRSGRRSHILRHALGAIFPQRLPGLLLAVGIHLLEEGRFLYCSWRPSSGLGDGRLGLGGRAGAAMLSMYSRVWAGTYFS